MSVDFAELRARIQHSLAQLESGGRDANAEAALRERAHQVASLRLDTRDREVVTDTVLVRRVESRFAFPVEQVLEVREVRVGRLPRRNRYVSGLFQLRGHIHCLVDMRPFVGQTAELDHRARSLAILLRGKQGTLGVRIDEVLGPRTVYSDELDTGRRERRLDFISHVTRDRVEIVDVDILFASTEFRLTAPTNSES